MPQKRKNSRQNLESARKARQNRLSITAGTRTRTHKQAPCPPWSTPDRSGTNPAKPVLMATTSNAEFCFYPNNFEGRLHIAKISKDT